jgi:peptidoglycan/LPS O-acetylase OafA/YrhL
MRTLWQRFKAPTPAFWSKVQKIGSGILAVAVYLLTADTTPAEWLPIIRHVITAVGAIVAMAQFACKDSTENSPNP